MESESNFDWNDYNNGLPLLISSWLELPLTNRFNRPLSEAIVNGFCHHYSVGATLLIDHN